MLLLLSRLVASSTISSPNTSRPTSGWTSNIHSTIIVIISPSVVQCHYTLLMLSCRVVDYKFTSLFSAYFSSRTLFIELWFVTGMFCSAPATTSWIWLSAARTEQSATLFVWLLTIQMKSEVQHSIFWSATECCFPDLARDLTNYRKRQGQKKKCLWSDTIW